MAAASKATAQFYATGRRKTASARVFVTPGKGKITVNKKTVEDYFGKTTEWVKRVAQPLKLVDVLDKYDIKATVKGGGVTGQAEALRHGIARALDKIEIDRLTDGKGLPVGDEAALVALREQREWRQALKKAGYIKRDPRAVLRKLVGLVKARKAKQFSKR